jgi:mono/diheme cytochrome c family protein
VPIFSITRAAALRNVRGAVLFVATSALAALAMVACGDNAPPTPKTGLERGAEVYAAHCQACHPGGGAGAGPSIQAVIPNLADDELRRVIRKGKNRMPGFPERVISEADLKLMIEYMRSWSVSMTR